MKYLNFKKLLTYNLMYKLNTPIDDNVEIIFQKFGNIFYMLFLKSNIITYNNKEIDSFNEVFWDKYFLHFYKNYLNQLINNTNYFNNLKKENRTELYSFILLNSLEIVGFDRASLYWTHINLNLDLSEKRYNLFTNCFDAIYESLFSQILKNDNIEDSISLLKHIVNHSLIDFGFHFNMINNHYGEKLYKLLDNYNFIFNNNDIIEANIFQEKSKKTHYLDINKNLSYGCILNPDFISKLIKKTDVPLEILFYIKHSLSHLVYKKLDLLDEINSIIKSKQEKNYFDLIIDNSNKEKIINKI